MSFLSILYTLCNDLALSNGSILWPSFLKYIYILKNQDTKKGKLPSNQVLKNRENYRSGEKSMTETHKKPIYNKGNNKEHNKRTQYMRLANYKESSEIINSQRCPDKQMTSRHNREPIFN